MSCVNDFDRSGHCNNLTTSNDSECSFPEISSVDSDRMDSGSDEELNVTADSGSDGKQRSVFESDLGFNLRSDTHSTDSWSSAVTRTRNASKLQVNSKLDCANEKIPGLVEEDLTDASGIQDDKKWRDELRNEDDDKFIMEQLEKLIIRRNKKDNEARLRWLTFLREQKEAEEEEKQFEAYWERRHQDDKDLWRDKDFANAIYKMCRAGYKGKHGHFDVPEQILQQMNALYMQVTAGDYDGNKRLKCAKQWKKLLGKTKIDCQKEFIKMTNRAITMYGWNPPDGWL